MEALQLVETFEYFRREQKSMCVLWLCKLESVTPYIWAQTNSYHVRLRIPST
jgi:hypothetical protein